MAKMKITFLGTGTSHGVPSLDCMIRGNSACPKGVCREVAQDKKHRRTRSSIFVEYSSKKVLIDVGPDFREQALREKITRIDAVLLTHSHADHLAGIPDIRSYTPPTEAPLQFFGSSETASAVRRMFSYVFDPSTFVGGGIPRIELETVERPFKLFGETVTPVPVLHGSLSGCFGWRIGNMGYIPDVKAFDDNAMSKLAGLSCLIIDCLRESKPHSSHIILPEAVEIARELKPKRCLFTHLSHDIHYKRDAVHLDDWMDFAWDSLEVDVE